ncbi:hypothetical protein ABPG72_014621 [Tetrahymena utriculariae]
MIYYRTFSSCKLISVTESIRNPIHDEDLITKEKVNNPQAAYLLTQLQDNNIQIVNQALWCYDFQIANQLINTWKYHHRILLQIINLHKSQLGIIKYGYHKYNNQND